MSHEVEPNRGPVAPDGSQGDARFAGRLLGSAARYEATPAAQARVLDAVLERHWPRIGLLLLRPALIVTVLVAVLVGATAIAGATLGRHVIARALHVDVASPPSVVPSPRAHNSRPASDETAAEAPLEHVEPGPEAALVVQAMNALRHDHDPARAAALLDEYRSHYPDGALAEEALVLAIEAATARHDEAAASSLANRYLIRYPAGRFAAVARAAGQ